jgi:hypothetical protein
MDTSEVVLYGVAILAVVMISVSVALMVYIGVGSASLVIQTPRDTPIYSLKDSTGIHGSFALGSGTVDSYPVYLMYTKDSEGAYKLITTSAYKSRIFMDTNTNPFIKEWYKCSSIFPSYCEHPYLIDVHAPNGTVVQEYRSG